MGRKVVVDSQLRWLVGAVRTIAACRRVRSLRRRLAGERSRGVEDRLAIRVVVGDDRVAFAVGEISADRERLDILEIVAFCARTVLRGGLNALEVVLHNEVDDAGDRIRSVHGRSATGDHLDA